MHGQHCRFGYLIVFQCHTECKHVHENLCQDSLKLTVRCKYESGKQLTSSDEANGIAQCQRCQNRNGRAGKYEVRKGKGGDVGSHVCICCLSNDGLCRSSRKNLRILTIGKESHSMFIVL